MEEISRQNKIHLPDSLQSGPLNDVISVGNDVSAWQLSIVFRRKETKLSDNKGGGQGNGSLTLDENKTAGDNPTDLISSFIISIQYISPSWFCEGFF